MAITYFPVTGNWTGFPQGSTVNGSVTLTPNLHGVALVTDVSPHVGEIAVPTEAVIVNGVLQSTPSGGTVELLAATSDLNLTGTLQYTVSFGPMMVDGQPVALAGFPFNASTDATPVDLIDVTPPASVTVAGLPMIPSTGISDSTVIGRELMTAADAAAARAAIGAAGGTGVLINKGATDCSTNPNYPTAVKGDAYVVTVAGKIGGASGVVVGVGDVYFATADNAGGTQASVGASWDVLPHTLVGALMVSNNLSDIGSAATARANLGLGNVDNVSDVNKPVSTAQAAADAAVLAAGVTQTTTDVPPLLKPTVPAATRFPTGSKMQSMFASGHGWVKRTGDTGTVADDTTVFTEGSQSISLLTSGTASASTTAVSPVLAPTLDLTQNSLVFKIRVDQWANLGTLFFLASNDASAALSTTRAIVSVAFAGSLLAADGEFAWIGVNPGDWATAGGFSAVTMSAVSRIAVQAQQGSGSAVQVNLQQVWTRPAPTTPATIITFDDGYGSQYTNAKPYMDKYGFRGVLFPIRDLISGSGTYVTIPQLQAFYDSGWDIVAHADLAASHNSTNALIDLSISDGSATALSTFEGELVRNKKWLIANGWTRSADFFGWPQGKFDAARLAIARKYFSLIRLYRPNLNAAEADTYPFVDGGRLKQLAVQGGGSPSSASSVTAALTAAWAAKKTVVLTFHGINSTSPQSYDYPVASFQTIIDFIAASGYPVKTLSAVMRDNGVDAPVGKADVAAKLTIPTGTPDGTKFARDDGTYAVPPGTGGLPTQTGNSGKVLTTNGTAASWGTVVSNPGVPTPTQNAMLGWTSDPLAGLNGNSAIPLTFVQVARIIADASGTVGNLLLHLGVLGTGQTSCEFQVFDSTGTLLGTTGDVKATMAGAVGGKKIPITVPFAVVAGATYYVAATSIGGTSPQLGRQGLTASPQVLTSDIIPIQRFGVVSGAVGSAPASITPGSLVTGGTAFWYGLKT